MYFKNVFLINKQYNQTINVMLFKHQHICSIKNVMLVNIRDIIYYHI